MAPMDVSIDASIHRGHSNVPVYKMDTDLVLMELHARVSLDDLTQFLVQLSCSIHHSCIDVWSNLPLAEIDECAEGIHNCDQICHNSDGSFTCSCRQGYQLARDGTTCLGESCIHCPHASMHDDVVFQHECLVHISLTSYVIA